jgi:hypothetical protein
MKKFAIMMSYALITIWLSSWVAFNTDFFISFKWYSVPMLMTIFFGWVIVFVNLAEYLDRQ